ncbi:DgyrCDS16 [Dimorphilus gyrociliatus]|uniref:DgyrCDS16 n=1 Tax=Dimorphilus gyrociliatus TaxID=2664684 RepID=A0A7I8V3M5_9ANNE|nr:DgyrCDS16 [Dimorphilus gyrociliatus]
MLLKLFCLLNFASFGQCYVHIPDFPTGKDYEWRVRGDLNIIILYPISSFSSIPCSPPLNPTQVLGTELLTKVLTDLNSNEKILPNISLGVTYYDDCGTINGGSARIVQIYQQDCLDDFEKTNNIIGILGIFSSNQALSVGSLSSQLKIPVLSTYATAEGLSNKAIYEYFTRLVPSDKFTTQAMMHFSDYHNWRYIQLVFTDGIFGENAAKGIQKFAKMKGICVANTMRVDSFTDFKATVDKLIKYEKAKVIVMFTYPGHGKEIIRLLNKTKYYDHFTFFGADSYRFLDGYEKMQSKSFLFLYTLGEDPKFVDHVSSLTPSMADHIWMKKLWEQLGDCHFETNCSKYANFYETNKITDSIFKYMFKLGDGMEAYARALHNLISDQCPEAFNNKTLLKDCTKGPDVLKYLREVKFRSKTGINYFFDDNGDMLGDYNIFYYSPVGNKLEQKLAGTWSKRGEVLLALKQFQIESICSRPCPKKHIYIPQDLECCWQCKKCRDNEIVIKNRTECKKCPEFYWPGKNTN